MWFTTKKQGETLADEALRLCRKTDYLETGLLSQAEAIRGILEHLDLEWSEPTPSRLVKKEKE